MPKDIPFIDLRRLNHYLIWNRRSPLFFLLDPLMYGRKIDGQYYAGVNPHRHYVLGEYKYVNLYLEFQTGKWFDREKADSGSDVISLFAYLYRLSPHKAALRIIEEMRLSYV